jgi:hypothetical protein
LPVRLRDAVAAPAYWPLLTIAMAHAVARLAYQPHHWDKTNHKPWRPG